MLKYLASRDGASSAEYAMLLGIVGGLVAIALFIFAGAVAEQMTSATATVASGGAPQTSTAGSSAGGGSASSAAGRGTSTAALAGGNGAANANGGNGVGGGAGGGRDH